jgi:methyl-accepting chemotaxis protein
LQGHNVKLFPKSIKASTSPKSAEAATGPAKRFAIARKLALSFGVCALLTAATGLVGILFVKKVGDEGIFVAEHLAPLGTAAQEIRVFGSDANRRMEAIVSGKSQDKIEYVWALLEKAQRKARTILDGQTSESAVFHAAKSPVVREKIASVLASIGAFEDAAKARYELLSQLQGAGSGIDEEFDTLYDKVIDSLVAAGNRPEVTGNAEVQRSLGHARFELANAHLFLEEILSGDEGENFSDVAKGFADGANHIAAAGAAIDLKGPLAQAKRLGEVAKIRYENLTANTAKEKNFSERYYAAFENFIAEAAEAEAVVRTDMAAGIESMKTHDKQALVIIAAIAAIAFAAASIIAWRMGASLGGGVRDINASMHELADGNLEIDIPGRNRSDELRDMAQSVEVFRQNAIQVQQLHEDLEQREQTAQREKDEAVAEALESQKAREAEMEKQVERATDQSDYMKLICRAYEHRFTSSMQSLGEISKGVQTAA